MKRAITIILVAIVAVLNPQLSNIRIFPNTETNQKVQTSNKVFALSTQVNSLHFFETNNAEKYNITLWVKDWEGNITFGNINVTIYDLQKKLASSNFSNETGHVDIQFLDPGFYVVSVQKENRTVGYKMINVIENGTYEINTWSYDLNVTVVNKNGESLANHTVIVYDQMVFQAPNHTITTKEVKRDENYTVITEKTGLLVRQAETDENGTVCFAGLWNGTYRLRISDKESWTGEYILGKYVLRYQEPAAGEYVMDVQEPTSINLTCVRVNLALNFISESNVPIINATIYIRNTLGHLYFKDDTNATGFVERKNVYVIDGVYAVSALHENRTIGYKMISVAETEIFTVECWAYNLTIKCVDQDGKPLPNHIVFLHDQLIFYSPTNITLVANQTGTLANWTKTDENGTAYFNEVWNGTYWIKVTGGKTIGENIIDLQKTESLIIICNKTYMALKFITLSSELPQEATILVFDNVGNLVFRDRLDKNGYIFREDMYLGNYTVHVEFMGTQVWSGTIDISKDRDKQIKCMVYRLTLRCVDQFGNVLPEADVTLKKKISQTVYAFTLEFETDKSGRISCLLPYGSYEVLCSSGIYLGSTTITLDNNYVKDLACNIKTDLWMMVFFVVFPLVLFTLLLERRKLRTPLEIKRYKNLLFKLESMYKNGVIEYRVYRKLREEYEAKIIELGGREMK